MRSLHFRSEKIASTILERLEQSALQTRGRRTSLATLSIGVWGAHQIQSIKPEYTAHEMYTQAKSMRSSSCGLDGWTVDAVKRLPYSAWQPRAAIENRGVTTERFLEGDTHVPCAMLPKGDGETPLRHTEISIFSVL